MKRFLLFQKRIIPRLVVIALVLVLPVIIIRQLTGNVEAGSVMTYQGRLVDQSGNLRTGTFCFNFKLYSSLTGGSATWTEEWCTGTETVQILSSNPGVFTLELGKYNSLTTLDLSKNYYLEIQVKRVGETYETLSPRRKLTGAIFASDSAKLGGQPASYYLNTASNATLQGSWTFNGSVSINSTFDITGASVIGLSDFETDPTLTDDDEVTFGDGLTNISLAFDSDAGVDGTLTYLGASDTFSFNGALSATGYNNTNWNTAYGWGDHSTEGYITDGNTNWDNSYGFITASSTETLTNKSGNISMWTNNSGYITDDTSVPKNHLLNSGSLSFTWALGELVSTVMAEGENISLLNNNSGYITDGNTNWDNSYGFITASSSNTLTNKSGNISM